MQKISSGLWFDKEAKEAAEFYVSVFGNNSSIKNVYTIHDTPSGDVEVVSFQLAGQGFEAISAGLLSKFNASISFSFAFISKDALSVLWKKLDSGGKVLMAVESYPFSERYGWLQDKYPLSWQIISMGDVAIAQIITQVIMFVGDVCGKAEEAIQFYVSVFHNSKAGDIFRYTKGQEPDKEGTIAHAFFTIENQIFAAMDSAQKHDFKFNEALSFIVNCKTQQEI